MLSPVSNMQKKIIQEQEKKCYKVENVNSVTRSSLYKDEREK